MILILSSFVAAGDVGGMAQWLVLAGIEGRAMLAPTVLFGRHPGHGPPGGGPVEPGQFASIIGGIEAAGAFAQTEAVICGYFAHPAQIDVAAAAIGRIRAARAKTLVVIDPIMGDAPGGLYVPVPVAEAISQTLAPLADLLAPNAWELQRLTGQVIGDAAEAAAAASDWGRPVLVSSVPCGRNVGVLWSDGQGEAWLAIHRRFARSVSGGGDLLTALFTAALVDGAAAPDALETAVADTAALVLGEEVEVGLERLS